MYPLGTLSTKKLLSFIRSAISPFAPWYLRCLFFRFACFLQQPSHPILVPQTKNCQSHEFRWAVPDAPVETLTGYSEPLGKFHLGQAKLLADPVKLSSIHFSMLGELCGDVQLRYIPMRATNVQINMRTILGAIGINDTFCSISTLPLLSPSSSCSEGSDSSQMPSPTFARKS
jgi:hypothetical protein